MLNVAQLETFYSYFFKKKYKDQDYKFRRTKTTISVCNSFLELVDKEYSLHTVGELFLWEYYLFQFQYWHDLTLENKFTDKVVIAFIIGKKAFERWKGRDREFDWQIESYSIIPEYGVQKKDLFTVHEQKKKVNKRHDSSKPIRKRYLNTEEGFAMCVQFTTLFDTSDMSCIRCNSRSECKELLRVNYPRLFKERIV
jgi:hypothetical protein